VRARRRAAPLWPPGRRADAPTDAGSDAVACEEEAGGRIALREACMFRGALKMEASQPQLQNAHSHKSTNSSFWGNLRRTKASVSGSSYG
jgi:hypothetical protein